MITFRHLLFSLFILFGFISCGLTSASAQEIVMPGVELYAVGYKTDDIVFKGEASRSALLRIDPTDGRVIEVGDTGFSGCTALDFNEDGAIYATCMRPGSPYVPVLVMLDPHTGKGTEIGETGVTENISDIAHTSGGTLYSYEESLGSHNLLIIDNGSGIASVQGSPGIEGQGNALIAWGEDEESLKLFTRTDGVNKAYELDKETAQPAFLGNIEMVNFTGEPIEQGSCILIAADSTRAVRLQPILAAAKLNEIAASTARIVIDNGSNFDAIALTEILGNGAPASEDVKTNFIAYPQYALSLIGLDPGVNILAKRLEAGYILDGIAIRPLQPRPIPTMSEWALILTAAVLGIFGLIAVRRKTAV